MNTYRAMKVGTKKFVESKGSASIENPKAKKLLDEYVEGLKSAHLENWQEIDLDPAVMYSTSGGMPHGRLKICDGVFSKSEVAAAAKTSNIKPANSKSYQDLYRRNQFLEKRHKNYINYSTHMKVLYSNAALPVPEEFEDDPMEDSDHVNQSSPSTENGGTLLLTSSGAGDQTNAPHQIRTVPLKRGRIHLYWMK